MQNFHIIAYLMFNIQSKLRRHASKKYQITEINKKNRQLKATVQTDITKEQRSIF